MSRRRVCLVTDELFPFTRGGIGRLTHNLIMDSLDRDAKVDPHLLLPSSFDVPIESVQGHFGGRVVAHWAGGISEDQFQVLQGALYPPPTAFGASRAHAHSLQILLKLKALEQEGLIFDTIEFPDHQGWGFCTIQEKRLGRGFARTEIAVRLHSTQGIVQQYENRILTQDRLGQIELERKTLHDADRVIAHLPQIARFNADYYDFDASWMAKVVVQFPPVLPLADATAAPRGAAGPRDLVFASRLQDFKRPDAFIRGAVLLMRQAPDFAGRAFLACHAGSPEYDAWLASLIPADLKPRFIFLAEKNPERLRLIAGGIVAVTSDYESLNLLAYEASAAGGTPVVNGACLAFADGGPFVDGLNCYEYDGTVEGLAAALERAFRSPILPAVAWKADRPYWEQAAPAARLARAPRARPSRVSVIVTNHNLGRYLPSALESVAASAHPDVEIVLVDDASTAPLDLALLDHLESHPEGDLKVVRNPVNRGPSASRNVGIRAATGDYILPLDADDLLSRRFIEIGAAALDSQPEYQVVVPNAAHVRDEADLANGRFLEFGTYIGETPSMGLIHNRLGSTIAMMRRGLFDRFHYNEGLALYEQWELYLRLALAGHRFLVTTDVQCYLRQRSSGLSHTASAWDRRNSIAKIYETLPHPLPRSVKLFPFLIPAEGPVPHHPAAAAPTAIEPRPLRHDLVDRVNRGVRTLSLGTKIAPIRYEWVDAMNRALKSNRRVHHALKRVLR